MASESRTIGARLAWLAGRSLRPAAVYIERPVLIVGLLGFSSGLPLALTGSTLAIWMADEGVDLGTIGLFSLVGLPYILKFLWAPAVDALAFPWLGRLLGRRRGWLAGTQLALIAAIAVMGVMDPATEPVAMALAALAVAFISATQDIVIDAFRVESLSETRYAAGMANYVAAYRVALLTAGAGAIALVEGFAAAGIGAAELWTYAYGAMAALGLIGLAATFSAREPVTDPALRAAPEPGPGWAARLEAGVVRPFADFAAKPHWMAILLFVILFKFGDAFAGAMVAPFALDIGFAKTDYAYIANGVGLPSVLAGGFVGGLLGRLLTLRAALWVAGLGQMVSNLAFCWLALVGADLAALTATVLVESFTAGIGTVIFVAYLSSLCATPAYTATQFALLSALAAVGRTVLSAGAGYVAASVGWIGFFLLTTAAAVPGLLLLAWLSRRPGMWAPGDAPSAPESAVKSETYR